MPPAEVLFAHFHQLLSLKDWDSFSKVSKEWNEAAKLFKNRVILCHISTLVLDINLTEILNVKNNMHIDEHYCILMQHYRASIRLQNQTTYSGIVPGISQATFMNATNILPEQFIANRVCEITKGKVENVSVGTYSLSESHLSTPAFHSLVVHTFENTASLTNLDLVVEDCFNAEINGIDLGKYTRTAVELVKFLEFVANNSCSTRITAYWLYITGYFLRYSQHMLYISSFRHNNMINWLAHTAMNMFHETEYISHTNHKLNRFLLDALEDSIRIVVMRE
jgi:hypothetical protein